MLKRIVLRTGQWLTLVVAGLLLIWMMIETWYGSIQSQFLKPSSIWPALLFTVLLIGFVVGLTLFLSRWKTETSWLIGTFIVLTLLKFSLTALVKIVPTSDFWSYQELAALSTDGMTWHAMMQHGFLGLYLIFPHALNVASFFSVGNTFLGTNFFANQLINISATFLDMLLLYWLGTRWLNRKMGILAALVFYAIPAYWIYSTLLNGAEPLMLTMWLIAMLALTNVLKPKATSGRNDQWVNLGIASIATLAAYMLRPTILVWPVVLIIMLIALALQVHPKQSRPFRQLGWFIGVIVVLIASTPLLYSWMYGINLSDSDGVDYSLATGTDAKTDGQYSVPISDHVIHELRTNKSLAKAYPEVASNLDHITQHNLQSLVSAGTLPDFVNNKMRVLMSEDYGFDWTVYNLSHHRAQRQSNDRWYDQRIVLLLLSFGYFDVMLILAFLSILIAMIRLALGRQRLTNHFFYSALLLDGVVLETLLFEVQGRYHIIFYLPLIALVVTGVDATMPWIKRRLKLD